MGLLSFLGGSPVDAIKDVALEWIDTDKESAEAKAVMVKALDPNGNMRTQISRDVTNMYKVYIYLTTFLLLLQATGWNSVDVGYAVDSVVELFFPITGLFGAIVTASFGVNGVNSYKNK